jgi:hypothetical protein
MSYAKPILVAEEIPIQREYLAPLPRTLEETRKWKVTMEEEPSFKITFKGFHIEAKKKVTYPIETLEFMRKMIVEILPAEGILIKPRKTIPSALEEEYGKSEQKLREHEEAVSNLNFSEIIKIMQYERRLNEILENVSRGIFTLEDAKDFIFIKNFMIRNKDIPGDFYKIFLTVRNEYLAKISAPSYSSVYATLIIGLLAEASKPLSYKELKNKVQAITREKFDRYLEYSFRTSLDILISPKHTTRIPLVRERGIFNRKYELTEEGKIVSILKHDEYNEVRRSYDNLKLD